METNYTSQAQALTTEELQAVLLEYREYEPEAVLAAIAELQKRGEQTPQLEQLQQELAAAAPLEPKLVKETPARKAKNFLMLFVPQPHYQVTPVILNLNLLVFGIGAILGLNLINPDAGDLVGLGANYGPYTLSGEWWRLLTSVFLHGGILHLLLNMVALVSIGAQLEALVGRTQFLLAYLLCGLSGSVISLWWTTPEVTVSVGASGAIFGLFGMMLILLLLEREMDWKSKQGILINMAVVIGINLAYGMRGGIDNAAHIGGLLAGIGYGSILILRSDRYIRYEFSALGNGLTFGAGILLLIGVISFIPFKGNARWIYTMDQVVINEDVALQAVIELDKAGDKYDAEKIMPMVETGIVLWDETEVLLEAIDDAPEAEQAKLTALLDYVRLRKMSYQMLLEDLKANRPLLNQKQQQMLGAINSYVAMLQNNDFSSIQHHPTTPEEAELAASIITGSDGKPVNPSDLSSLKEPLFILDGEEIGRAPQIDMLPALNELDFDDIENVTVFKTEEAVKIYGEKGVWGVVRITTKK